MKRCFERRDDRLVDASERRTIVVRDEGSQSLAVGDLRRVHDQPELRAAALSGFLQAPDRRDPATGERYWAGTLEVVGGAGAVPALTRRLRELTRSTSLVSEKITAELAIAGALLRLSPGSLRAAACVQRAISSPDAETRRVAIGVAGSHCVPGLYNEAMVVLRTALAPVLEDPDDVSFLAALPGLVQDHRASAIARLRRLVLGPPVLRGGKLWPILRASYNEARDCAVHGVALEHLHRLDDLDWRLDLASLLGVLVPEDVRAGVARDGLQLESPSKRLSAARLLEDLPPDVAAEVAAGSLDEPDPYIRSLLERALSRRSSAPA